MIIDLTILLVVVVVVVVFIVYSGSVDIHTYIVASVANCTQLKL